MPDIIIELTDEQKDKLRAKIEEMKEQRKKFIEQANAEIAAVNGRIAQLEELIGDVPDNPGE